MAKKRRRRGKRKAARRKSRRTGGHIPLPILVKRAKKLNTIVMRRGVPVRTIIPGGRIQVS